MTGEDCSVAGVLSGNAGEIGVASDELLIRRAKEVAEIAMRDRALGQLLAPYTAVLLLAMAARIESTPPPPESE